MLTSWADVDRTFAALDQLTRRLDSSFPLLAFDGFATAQGGPARAAWREHAEALELTLEVPGFGEKDIEIALDRGLLSVSGKPSAASPEGYVAQRRERGVSAFRYTWRVRVPIDPEGITATLKNGVLTVSLPKRAEARPRTIPVQTQA